MIPTVEKHRNGRVCWEQSSDGERNKPKRCRTVQLERPSLRDIEKLVRDGLSREAGKSALGARLVANGRSADA